jgi:GTPase SAR1 family protein
MRDLYMKTGQGFLLVFSITSASSVEEMSNLRDEIIRIKDDENVPIVIVGNKADLTRQEKNEREVTREEAEEWARKNNIMEYVETSAKSGENVEKAFMRVAERIHQNIQAGKYDLNDRRSGVKGPGAGNKGQVRLSSDASKSSSGGCC